MWSRATLGLLAFAGIAGAALPVPPRQHDPWTPPAGAFLEINAGRLRAYPATPAETTCPVERVLLK